MMHRLPLSIVMVACSIGSLHAQPSKAVVPTHENVAYGVGDEILDLYLPTSPRPAPVFVFAHAKGQTLKSVPREKIKRLLEGRMAFVSIEANDFDRDGRQEVSEVATWERVIEFLRSSRAKYGLDMDNLFVGGRSLGSVGAFQFAMKHPHSLRGVFCTQAIPDRGESFAKLVTKDAPPCRFVFKTRVGSNDHDPINGVLIRDAYEGLGIGSRFKMKAGIPPDRWYDELREFIARNRVGPIADYDPRRFAGAIGAFQRDDKASGVVKGKTVFVGSSSIARLDREAVFPNHPMTLRGLRGGQISDLNHYAEQVVLRYEPSRVVFFCGGNDLWNGHTAEEVLEDFQEFTERLFERVPECRVIQLAIRPSIKKRDIIPTVLRTNELLEQNAARDGRVTFLRGSCDRFLDQNGEPIEALYHADRNHMSEKGYAIWSEIVTPHLGPPHPDSNSTGAKASAEDESAAWINTVSGPIPASELGRSLSHEHVLVDFVGAEKTGYHRWDRDEVVRVVLPHLLELKEAGYQSLFECTPAHIGRDPRLLQQLSDRSGLHLITNTGYYGAGNNKFLPATAVDMSADELAAIWIDEFRNGIEGTSVRPGFIKIGVDGKRGLSPLHQRLARAACKAHLQTGLTIASHTGPNASAFQQAEIVRSEGVSPKAFIWVHATSADVVELIKAARVGMWVSLDNITKSPRVRPTVQRLVALKEAGLLGRVLISHDAGWYSPKKPRGGTFIGYTLIERELVPALLDAGFHRQDVEQLLIKNPAEAFTIKIRGLSPSPENDI